MGCDCCEADSNQFRICPDGEDLFYCPRCTYICHCGVLAGLNTDGDPLSHTCWVCGKDNCDTCTKNCPSGHPACAACIPKKSLCDLCVLKDSTRKNLRAERWCFPPQCLDCEKEMFCECG